MEAFARPAAECYRAEDISLAAPRKAQRRRPKGRSLTARRNRRPISTVREASGDGPRWCGMAPLGKLPTDLIECETLNAGHPGEFIEKYGADKTYVEKPLLKGYKRR
jgi:hypothetical protein